MKNLNQYLQKRGDRWHYVRRVPSEHEAFDKRGTIRKALKTESLELARKRRDKLMVADDNHWSAIAQLGDGKGMGGEGNDALKLAANKYVRAKATAMALGFDYAPIDDLKKSQAEGIILRLNAIYDTAEKNSFPKKYVADALFGAVEKPKVSLSQAFEVYCETIVASELIGKSAEQKNNWLKPKKRALKNFNALHGDLAMSDINRQHAQAFQNWWLGRLIPDDPKQKALRPNTANRDIGTLSKLYRLYWRYMGEENRKNPFRNLRFGDEEYEDREFFADEWVCEKVLSPGIFNGLNREAALIVYGLIETGCRPSELANLMPENIMLNAEIPHICIRATSTRSLKSKASTRNIPLVGVSLAAFQEAPDGFPHYRDKSALLSASLMKAFRSRSLFPTEGHNIYSFRHSFEKRMQEAGIDYGLRCLLMGHKDSRPKYGGGGSMEYRRDQLLKIAHPFEGFLQLR